MRPHDSGLRSGCPELEALAAFVEGRLEATERTAVVEHLADCEACREVVAESRAIQAELGMLAESNTAEVHPFPKRVHSLRRWGGGVAAALALVGVGFGITTLLRPPSIDELAIGLVHRGEAANLPETWADPVWSVMRGEGAGISDRAVAFRLGVRTADMALALTMKDRDAARRLAAEISVLLVNVPFAEPIESNFRDLAVSLVEPPADWTELARIPAVSNKEIRQSVDEALFDLGRWAEAGRFLGAARSTIAPGRPPKQSRSIPELADLSAAAAHAMEGADLAAREAAFQNLVARGGDLRY